MQWISSFRDREFSDPSVPIIFWPEEQKFPQVLQQREFPAGKWLLGGKRAEKPNGGGSRWPRN